MLKYETKSGYSSVQKHKSSASFWGVCSIRIQESGENYLETILALQNETGTVHSVDVARRLGFTKPSISRAMGILRKKGYIVMQGNGLILLTPAGRELAEQILEKHRLLTEWLKLLGVSPETADADACRIEHIISPEAFQAIKQHVKASRSR